MKVNLLRRLALLCAVLTCGMLLALPAAAAEADAPYAEDGDMDYIRSYVVTVDPREDGSVDITYDIDWQVIDGDKTDYLSWVKIGLANSSVDELTPLTDTISDLQYTSDGGSYAKVVFRHRYYAPDVAAANGGESSVHFAFSVHQSHLFTKNDDGTANFAFTPGWFDDLSIENMQVRWHNYDGFVADNTGVDGDYLTWDFGAMGHGQQAMVHVTVPVTNAAAFDPGAAMTTDDYDSGEDLDEIIGMLVTLVVVLLAIAIIIVAIASQSPEWGGGFGGGGGFFGHGCCLCGGVGLFLGLHRLSSRGLLCLGSFGCGRLSRSLLGQLLDFFQLGDFLSLLGLGGLFLAGLADAGKALGHVLHAVVDVLLDVGQGGNGFLEGGLDLVQRLHDVLLNLLRGSAGVLLQLAQHFAQLLCVDGQLVGADEDERDDHDDHEFPKTNFHILPIPFLSRPGERRYGVCCQGLSARTAPLMPYIYRRCMNGI